MVDIARYEELSKLLRAKYEDARDTPESFTLQEVATAAGFSQAYITQLHAGSANRAVAKWQGPQAFGFLRAHRFTTDEVRLIADRHDLQNVLMYLEHMNSNQPMRVKEGGRRVRFLGSVSAGRFGEAFVDDEGSYVDIPTTVLRHYDAADVFALDIVGDSMLSDDARGRIPPGSRAFFHALLRPSVGQIVCARLERDDTSVIKVFRPNESFTTLESLNRKHRPIVVDKDNPAVIEGVLIGVAIPF